MGEHHLNPVAQLNAKRAPNERLVRVVPVSEGLAVLPRCEVHVALDAEKNELVFVAMAVAVKESALAGGGKVVPIPVAEMGRMPVSELQAAVEAAVAEVK